MTPNRRKVRRRKRPTALRVRRDEQSCNWRLVHPRCARDRALDMEEVQAMVAAGEVEIATDELRWLLDGCGDFVEAHALLGKLALEAGDLKLARGHLGYAYEISIAAIDNEGIDGTLPYALEPNRAFFEAARGLVECLQGLGKRSRAREVAARMLEFDPTDPLGFGPWAEPRGGKPRHRRAPDR